MKKTALRLLSIGLAIIMLVSVLPLNVLAVKTSLQEINLFRAEIYANGKKATNTKSFVEYISVNQANIFSSVGNISTPVQVYYKLAKEDFWYQFGLKEWEAIHVFASPSHITETGEVTIYEYYEAILMDLINRNTNGTNETLKMVDGVASGVYNSIYSSYTKTFTTLMQQVFAENPDITVETITTAKTSKTVKNLLSKVTDENSYKKTSALLDLLETCGNVRDAIKTVSAYSALCDYFDGTKEVLSFIANDQNSTNPVQLKIAANNILSCFDESVQSSLKSLEIGGIEMAIKTAGQVIDNSYSKAISSNPYLLAAYLTAKTGRFIFNELCSVDKQAATYYQIEANAIFENELKRVVDEFRSRFNASKTEKDAKAYLRAVQMFEDNILLGCDYVYEFASTNINTVWNTIFGLNKKHQEALNEIISLKGLYQMAFEDYENSHVSKAWRQTYGITAEEEDIINETNDNGTALSGEKVFADKIAVLKKEYPQGKYWNQYNGLDSNGVAKAGDIICSGTASYDSKQCISHGYCAYKGKSCSCKCGYFHGWQCFGFANLMAYKVFGSYATNGYTASDVNSSKGWVYYKSVSSYYVGDVVRINNNHSIFITKIIGAGIQYVDCNNSGPCKINWNNTITAENLAKKTTFVVRNTNSSLSSLSGSSVNGSTVSNTVSYKISSAKATSITNKSATISVGLNQKASVSKWTYFVSTNKNALVNLDGTSGSTHKSTNTVTCRRILDYQANPKYEKSDTFTISKHQGEDLKPNTTYYYKVTVSINGKWYSTGVQSFKTTNYLPDAASLRVSRDSQVVGVGDSITLLWDSTKNTDTYSIEVKDVNGITVQKKTNIKGLTYTLDPISESGAYTATITSVNAVGEKFGTSAEFTVEPNRLVRFYDTISDEMIYEESVPYGHSANAPKAPTHYGHTFSQWNRSYEKIKDSGEGDEHIITVNTVYDLNTYTVRFIDAFTNEIISSQSVKYKKSAVAPVSLPEHKGFEFISWDKGYSSIEKDTDIYTVYQWEDPDHLAILTIDGVTRTIPKENSEENVGYDVSVTISNSADRIISGRVVAVLKSAEGTILSQSESAAFAVDKAPMDASGSIIGTTDRQVTFTVLYDDFAPQIELYLINDYDKLGQLAPMVSTDIDNTGVWSGLIRFEGDEPPVQSDPEKGITVALEGPFNETIKYYRYRILEKSYETSASTAGYTQSGYTKVNAQQKSVDYVVSWPSGFLKTNSLYTQYNKQPVTASETATQIIEVSSPTTKGYIYYHWCMGTYANGPINRGINGSKTSTYKQFHAFYTTSAVSFDSSAKAYKKSVSGTCKDTYWWYGLTPDKSGNIIVKTQNYTVYDKLYNYYSEYSEWIPYVGECPLTNGALVDGDANKTYEVETKTETNDYYCYKYCINNTPEEPVFSDDDPRVVSISGTISSKFAAKTATVWIYKYSQASDYTTEYVGNTIVGCEGQLSIERAVLREAPSVQSGDYTIVVSVPGQEQALHLGTIKAPKAKYTVVFEDYFGNVISSQEITEGDSAFVPDSSLTCAPAGYRFARWSESVVNVRGNLTVKPEFEKMTFVVAFVDWNDQSVILNENIEYGSELVSISSPAEIEGYDTEWVVQIDDQYLTIEEFTDSGYTVTGNMVVTTRNTPKDYSVIFLDADPEVVLENKLQNIDSDKLSPIGISENTNNIEVLANTTVTYGIGIDYSAVIELEENEDYVFMGWINAATGEALESADITESVVLYPRYVFAETVEIPVASMDNGEYSETIEVELTQEFESASIWYTLDGTDPKISNTAMEYTGTIIIDHSCVLRYYSSALGFNDSDEGYRAFAVNLSDDNRYHVVTVYAVANVGPLVKGEPSIGLVKEGITLPNSLFSDAFEGYAFNGVYKDFDCSELFVPEAEEITDSLAFYAHYEPIEYTVHFYGFDGSSLSTQTVSYGNKAEAPIAPEVDGYVLAGWDGDYSFVDDDLDVFARYITPDEYATISLDKKAITLNVGASYANLQTTITPTIHSNYEIEWYSSNDDIASVDENGVITALSIGFTTITAKLPYTGETAEVTVKVAYDLDREIVLLQGATMGFDVNRNLRLTPNNDLTVDGVLRWFENANLSICKADGTELSGDDLVGTGCVVRLMNDGDLIDFSIIILTGDYNGDGKINNRDVVMLNQLIMDKRDADIWQIMALDVNGDGYINNRDSAMLARYLVGKETL